MTEFPPLLVQLLYNRGITRLSQVEPFLIADERLVNDPFLLPDMHQAVNRIYRALLSGEKIAVYGDFDADGITATVLLVEGLSALGGTVVPYIPSRLEEGYGVNTAALTGLYQQGVTLVITVDCGISAVNEVRQAQEMGLDVIVSDHHTVPPILPPAVAVINPKRLDSVYPFDQLAGVGVAYKLLQALTQGNGKGELLDRTAELVALGTVADMVPLLDENRYLVRNGLNFLNTSCRPGVQEMVRLAGLEPGNLNAESISWTLGPRLNAAGRLNHSITSYQLLWTHSLSEAAELALELEKKNADRQKLTSETWHRAREKVLTYDGHPPLLMIGDPDYSAGVIGIVAGKIADEFYRPTIVLQIGTEVSKGSGRSIPEFNLIAALMEQHELLSHFGGHPMAAGFTLPTENILQLEQQLTYLAAKQLEGIKLQPHLTIDTEIALSSLSGETYRTIQQLAPFGTGNPAPVFISRKVKVVDCRNTGNNGKHLKLKVRQGRDRIVWDAIGFNLGSSVCEVTPQLDIVYTLGIDNWRGQEMLQLTILDFAPSR